MKNFFTIFIALFFVLNFLNAESFSSEQICELSQVQFGKRKRVLEGKVISVSDGDTLIILDKYNIQYKIRLNGIDAPERGQDYSKKSTEFLKTGVKGKRAYVNLYGRDKYKREIGVICVDGINWNAKLIEAGFAWQYTKYNSNLELKKLQEIAKSKNKGLWASFGAIPPWEYRKRKKFKRNNNSELIKKGTHDSKALNNYWINSSSNSRHNSSCKWYKNTKRGYITTETIGKACGICGG